MAERRTLTDRFVAGAKASTRVTFFDAKVRGLALRVTPTGAKSWVFVYRTKGKPSQWISLGSYPALQLAAARKLALEQRHAVDVEARDPAEERRAEKLAAKRPAPAAAAVFTFTDLAKLYEAFAKGRKKTWQEDARKIRKYLLPAWGAMPVRDVTRRHVHEVLDVLVARGMTTGANRVQAVISRMFYVALDRDLIDAHPAARVMKRHVEAPRTRSLTDAELRQLWHGLQDEPNVAKDCVALRLLLGQRMIEELMPMAWAELDLQAGLWIIPRERTKNGKQPHTVPLVGLSLAILARRRELCPDGEPRVFPQLKASTAAYRELSALTGGAYVWTDLRRTMATRMAGLGTSETTIGRVLNHAKVTVTARHYNQHAYDAEKRTALETWDREIRRLLAPAAAE